MILSFIYLAGFPPTTVHDLTSLYTHALAPTTAPSPIVTPGPMNASAATHALASIIIGFSICSCCEDEILCEAVHK